MFHVLIGKGVTTEQDFTEIIEQKKVEGATYWL